MKTKPGAEGEEARTPPPSPFSQFISFCLCHIKHCVLVPMSPVTDILVPTLSIVSAGPGERRSLVWLCLAPGPRSGGGLPGCRRALGGGVLLHSDTLPGPFSFTSPGPGLPKPPSPCHVGRVPYPAPPPTAMQPGAPIRVEGSACTPRTTGICRAPCFLPGQQVESPSPFQVPVTAPNHAQLQGHMNTPTGPGATRCQSPVFPRR